jgi:hypothetical protein
MQQLDFGGLGIDAAVVAEKRDLTALPSLAHESLHSPERPRLRLLKVAVISGPSFSGKDSVMKILAERHGWHIYDGTEDGFSRRGDEAGTPIERPIEAHVSFDETQAEKFAKLRPGDEKWVHQTRLGGIILASEVDKRNEALGKQNWDMQQGEMPENPIEPIPAVSILLWTSKRVRLSRAVRHARELAKKEGKPIPKRESVIDEIRKKEADDTRSWRKRFGSIKFDNNPFSRRLARKNGQPVYNRFVITDNLTVEQVADRIENFLIQLGAADIIIPGSDDDQSGVGTTDQMDKVERVIFDDESIEEARRRLGAEPPQNIAEVEEISRKLEARDQDGDSQENKASGKEVGEPTSRRFETGEKHHPNPRHPSKKDSKIVAQN